MKSYKLRITNWLSVSMLLFIICNFAFVIPTYAHGFGQRIDLPVPFGEILAAGGFAVLISFVLLAIFSKEKGREPEELSRDLVEIKKLSGIARVLKILFTILFVLTL